MPVIAASLRSSGSERGPKDRQRERGRRERGIVITSRFEEKTSR